MPKDKYQFRLKNEAGLYYKMDGDTLITTGTVHNIGEAVDSWGSMQLAYKRAATNKGVFKKYSPDKFRFVNEGAKILRQVFNGAGNVEAKVWLEVYKLRSTDQQYYELGTFQLNMKHHVSEELYVDEMLMEGGISAKLKAFENTDFAIEVLNPFDDPDGGYIMMDGILLYGKYTFDMLENINMSILGGDGMVLPLVYVNQEGSLPFGTANPAFIPYTQWPGGDFDSAYQFKIFSVYDFKVNISFNWYLSSLSPDVSSIEVWVNIRGVKPGVASLYDVHIADLDISGGAGTGGIFTGSLPYGSIVTAENYIIVYFRCISSSDSGAIITFGEKAGKVEIEYRHTMPQTYHHAMTQRALFKKLVGKVTGDEANAHSTLLSTDVYPDDTVFNLNPYNTYFTCGDALRGLPTAEGVALGDGPPTIKTNLKTFAQDAWVSNCACLGIELVDGVQKIVLEDISHFYQKDVLMFDVGSNISKFRMEPIEDSYRANSIKGGYKPNTLNDTNARYEFNSAVGYKTAVEQTLNDLDYSSPYEAGCYAAEFMRLNLEDKKTTDSSGDNTVFKLQSNGNNIEVPGLDADVKQLERAHTVVAGIPADIAETVFNIPFSPARNMNRMIRYLASVHYGIPLLTLSHETSDKNGALIASMYSGSDIQESGDIIMNTDNPLFKPFVFYFDTPSPIDLDEVMSINPYGVGRFKVVRGGNSCILEGFVLDAGINPGVKETYSFVLLCAPDVEIPLWL